MRQQFPLGASMTFPIFDLGNMSYLTAIKFDFVSCNKTLLGKRIVLWFVF
jgi:hypothetical protein